MISVFGQAKFLSRMGGWMDSPMIWYANCFGLQAYIILYSHTWAVREQRNTEYLYIYTSPVAMHTGPAVATGGRGGGSAPLEKFEPPLGCAVPFAETIGIEVYPPPPGILSAPPLLTIPGYGAACIPPPPPPPLGQNLHGA